MEFIFETFYHQKALTVMARALRKTVRKKRSHRSHIFGWIVVISGILLSILSGDGNFAINGRSIFTWLAIAVILIALICEDALNGYFARKRMLPGTEKAISVFTSGGFTSTTEIGKTEFHYDKILTLAETKEYFVFVFSMSHAQIYDKHSISGGSADEFREFIAAATGKVIERI